MAAYLLNLSCILLLFAAAIFWWQTQGVKQLAYDIARGRCDDVNVQLLDQSVMLKRVRFRRHSGRFSVVRCFVFEFSTSGDERYHGEVKMSGRQLMNVEMEAYRITNH